MIKSIEERLATYGKALQFLFYQSIEETNICLVIALAARLLTFEEERGTRTCNGIQKKEVFR